MAELIERFTLSFSHKDAYIAMSHACRIFIDDERAPPHGEWLVARTKDQFCELLRSCSPSVISFDHDLGCDQAGSELPNGQHCMHYLIDQAMELPSLFEELALVILHSANPVGRANMRGLLESAQRHGILDHVKIREMPVTSLPIGLWNPDGAA